jgi:hypothetical protein
MTGTLWKCQRASLNDNDCEQGMNPHLSTPANTHRVQPAERLEATIQPFDGRAALHQSLPLRRLVRRGECLAVRWIRVDDRPAATLSLNQSAQRL